MDKTGLRRTALALALILSSLPAARPAAAQPAESRRTSGPLARTIRVDTIRELLSLWRPDVHLYVLGDVSLEDDAREELAAWLADRHWTVLLVQDATGQSYTDVYGALRLGEDAIEHGTGQGIPQRPGFSEQVHPRTQEPDGAIFTIVLAQRALFYTGSAAQDSRFLGEDRFQGDLDQWAIAALRSSGDVVRAVKDTVTNVDLRLAEAIDQEHREAERSLAQASDRLDEVERRARELREISPGGFQQLAIPDLGRLRDQVETARAALGKGRGRAAGQTLEPVLFQLGAASGTLDGFQKSIDAARSVLQAVAGNLSVLDEGAAALRRSNPQLSGSLVRPDVSRLREELAAAELMLAEDPGQAFQAAQAVGNQALAQIRAIEEYPAVGKALEAARTRLAGLERHERAGVASESLATARRHLAAAQELHDRGTPGYAEELQSASGALDAADRQISAADAAAARFRGMIQCLLFLLAAAAVAGGYALNRRRLGVKLEAEQLLADWRTALDRKLEVLFDELEQRVARFVGPAGGEGKLPHAGETLRLAEQIRADVGSLSILWASANSVLEKAEVLIRARRLGAVYNFFLAGRYEQGIALLKDEPVPFDPADGLPRLFGQERTWRDDLLGDLASYAPFRKAFQEIVGELNLRAARATEALDLIERSVVQGPADLAGTEERIRQAGSLQPEIERAGSGEGLFLVPALFAAALPAARAALARARERFPTDPVAALRGDGALACRIAVEALRLAGLVAAARHGVLASVAGGVATLREVSIGTGWIEAEGIRLSGQADLLAARAAEEPVATGIEELAQSLAERGLRVDHAVVLCGVLGRTARPEILRVTGVVQTARGELGPALGLSPDRLLREEDADPSERLDAATRQAETAHGALGEGELDAAGAALAEAARLTAEAAAIVEATRQAFAAHETTVDERRAETARIEGLLPDHTRILAGIRETFAPSVLLLRAGDPDHPSANGTLEDNLEETRAHVGLAHEKVDRAMAAHRNGKLLASADLLRQVAIHQELAVHRLAEIAEREARLARTVESNRSLLETLESRVREDQVAVVGDPRIMQPTLAAFWEGSRQVDQARRAVEAAPGDPLIAEDELLAAKALLDGVHDRMAPGDRLLHAEARRSAEAAGGQLAAAQELARRAAGDGIPDSPAIASALHNLESLANAQTRAREVLDTPHGDWNALDEEADRITAEAARCAATLTGEIAAAEQASAALSSATSKVREASYWSGGYGVVISGQPWTGALARARELLAEGRYQEAGQEAQQAYRAAADALEAAQAEVRRRRAEEERREEARRRAAEERRRREASASSFVSSSHGSSSGSSRSSWGGGGSSGSGRSSWGSSGSGSGKSRW